MTVKFNVVERGNPADAGAPKKFYPSVVSTGRKTLRQIATRITQISTVSSTDTLAVLEALLNVIPEELAAVVSLFMGSRMKQNISAQSQKEFEKLKGLCEDNIGG